jgi:tuftelin-interacting protein 11
VDEELDEPDGSSDSDEESSESSEDAEEAPQIAQVDEDDMDIDAGDENTMDDEEEQKPTRGGIGSNRIGIGGGRTGLGMNFARAGTLPETEPVEPQPTAAPGGRGGIGSSSRAAGIGTRKVPTFAPPSSTTKPRMRVEDGDEPSSSRVGLGAINRSNYNTTQADSVASSSGQGIPPRSSNSGTSTPQQAGLPTAFGSRTQRAFVRNTQPTTPGVAPVQLSYEEKAHFAKIAGGFGARMMAKMGWEAVR